MENIFYCFQSQNFLAVLCFEIARKKFNQMLLQKDSIYSQNMENYMLHKKFASPNTTCKLLQFEKKCELQFDRCFCVIISEFFALQAISMD